MTDKQHTELTKRAFDLGFRRGYEIGNRTLLDNNISKGEFVNIVLETATNFLDSTAFESISAELDLMNEKLPFFNGWKVFADGVIQGAGENFLDRTGNELPC